MHKLLSVITTTPAILFALSSCGGGGGGGGGGSGTVGSIPSSITWTAPTQNTDGTPLLPADLSKYRIYYGPDANSLQQVYEFPAGGNSLSFDSLSASDQANLVNLISNNSMHFYAMTAVNSQNIESSFSNIAQY